MRRATTPVFALLAVAALVVGACGGPSAPALTDPKEILVKTVEALQAVKTVHLEVEVSGTIPFDLTGSGAGGNLDLAGTTAEGDVDVPNDAIRLTFSAPALLGAAGEVIQVGGFQYVKVNLLGDKYQKQAATSSTTTTDPTEALADLRKGLDELKSPPTKQADERCGDADCYRVQIAFDAADYPDLAATLGGGSVAGTLEVWTRKTDLRPAKATVSADVTAQGQSMTIGFTVTLSDYDKGVSISAPPADQISE